MRKKFVLGALTLISSIFLGHVVAISANAQEPAKFPTKPVRLIVTSQAGNVTDSNARLLGAKLSAMWGQPVIVEQKVGANGAIGTDYVAKSPPDGHTILVTTTALVQTLALRKEVPYDVRKDLAPVSQLFFLRLALVVDKSLGVKTLGEFIQLAKKNPGKYTFGSFGIGSTAHLAVAKLNNDLGLDIVHVPYQGTPASTRAIVAGEVSAALVDPFSARAYIESGKLTVLATTGARRSPYFPEIPTFEQAGVKGFSVDNWAGWLAPGGTPQAILDKISADIARVQAMPDVAAAYEKSGIEIAHSTPMAFKQIVNRDAEYWADLVRIANIKPE